MDEEITPRLASRLSSVLYLLCGGLLLPTVLWLPLAPGANRGVLVVIACIATASGAVIGVLPWSRWPDNATLLLVPPTFTLIAAHNYFAANEGYRYAPFFFVTFGWIGLVHNRWISAKFAPLAAVAYLAPLALRHQWTSETVSSAVYVLPACVMLGEAVAWVSTRLSRSQQKLRERELSVRKLFFENPQPMWVYSVETLRFIEVNDAAIAHYGYRREEFLAMRVVDVLVDGESAVHADGELADRRASGSGVSSAHLIKGGRRIDVESTAHRLSFDGIEAMLVAIQDVTHREQLEEQLRHRAFHDSLTELANRALFADRVDHALARGSRGDNSVAVVMIDLDGFKTINDSLGHSAGDELLVGIARRLGHNLRPGDTAARLGGDEFAILFEDATGVDDATERAERLLAALAEPIDVQEKRLIVNASGGVALNRGVEGAEELIRNADMAMYLAKRDGKACIRAFEPAMHQAALKRLELETDFRCALRNDEFFVLYQPTYCLQTGGIAGFEALVRWQHPRKGLLSPAEFIPVAEETGLIVDLGRLVLQKACAQAALWRARHPELSLHMSVNLSSRQLRDPNLVDDVAAAIAHAGVDPRSLTLEITESVLMADTTATLQTLHALKSLGVRLAIDDFGTGYSSLSYLRTLPIDVLKIDKAFVDGVATDKEATGLVQAILRMASTLQLETIAEGVEYEEQAVRLEELGSSRVQGFYFSRPLPADAIDSLLEPGVPVS